MKRKFKHSAKRVLTLPSELNFWQKINFRLIKKFIIPVMFLLIAGILIVLAQWAVLTKKGSSFSVDEPSPETYRVISSMRYDDYDSAKTLRNMVSESVVGVAVRDMSAKSRLQRRLASIKDNNNSSQQYLSSFPEALLKAISNLNETDKSRILNLASQVGNNYIDRLAAEKVYTENSQLMNSILWEEINKLDISQNDANFIYQILIGTGNLNFRIDDELTELARQAAVKDVPNVDRKLEPGDVIVQRGEIITKQIAVLLRLQGYTEDTFPFMQLLTVFVCVIALPMWFEILGSGTKNQKPNWWCVVFIIVTAWICETIAARFGINGAGVLAPVVVSYLCIPDYFGFCIAITASLSGVFIISGQAVSNSLLLSIMAVTASTIGFYLLRKLESSKQVFSRMFVMTVILTLVRMFMRYIQGPELFQDDFRLFIPLGMFWRRMGYYFICELLMSNGIVVVLQYFEEALGVLSILTLRDISHPSNPLLRDLQRYAPGTYQHCLTIATLIEAVGLELGMDVNLLRAGAYYHDIGKLRKPQFFVENQESGFNPHDEMSPMLSSITIISHVKDGLELAWEAKLPKRIRDFIAEHHGTTCTFYFYRKALAEGENVEKADFTYPGPAPQSRETALLMIVDSVEAAVRAANIRELESEDTNKGKGHAVSAIEKIVNQVVASKINENQFDEVDFTQKDLAVIKKTLVNVLISMYHTRKVKKIENKK